MDSFAILLFALIIVVYFIPCTRITISENFRGGGHSSGFGGMGGRGGIGGRGSIDSSHIGGYGHSGNLGAITSGSKQSGKLGYPYIGGSGRRYGGYGGYGDYRGYWGNSGWWIPSWDYVVYDGVVEGDYVDENEGDVVISDNSNYTNNYYNTDFDSDYVSPLQQHLLSSKKEEQQ